LEFQALFLIKIQRIRLS